jgi:hypothetical protein
MKQVYIMIHGQKKSNSKVYKVLDWISNTEQDTIQKRGLIN